MLKQPGGGTANLAPPPWSRGGAFGGLGRCESAGSSLPAKLLGRSLCHGSCGRERLDPGYVRGPLWGAGTARGLTPHPVPGRLVVLQAVMGAASQLLALPYPLIFSEASLAVPAAWDVLVSQIGHPFAPPTAGVAAYPVTPRGLPLGRTRDGSRVVLRAKRVAQLLGSKSTGNRMAEAGAHDGVLCGERPGVVGASLLPVARCRGRTGACRQRQAGMSPVGGAGGGCRAGVGRGRSGHLCGRNERGFPPKWWSCLSSVTKPLDPRSHDLSAGIVLLLSERLYPRAETGGDEKRRTGLVALLISAVRKPSLFTARPSVSRCLSDETPVPDELPWACAFLMNRFAGRHL